MRKTVVAAVAAFFALTPIAVSADLPSLNEPIDPLVGAALQTQVFGVTDIDPSSLVVTDDDLLSVGQSSTDALGLLADPRLLVDDDKAQCPNATFTKIQDAVNAALPGDTIRVCPGNYTENVFVAKPLTIQAVRDQGQATECQAPVTPDPTKEAILTYPAVGANPDIGFNLEADGIVLDGFFVRPSTFMPLVPQATGIFTTNSHSGYQIFDNVLQGNTQGLYPNSDGLHATLVKHNCFRNNNRPGAASGNGIYSDEGLHNATIEDNFFTQDTNAAMVIDTFLTKPSGLTITHNTMMNDSSIALFHVQNSVVSYNHSVASAGSAIFVGGDTNALEISHNRLENGSFNGISIHDDDTGPPTGPNVNLLVTKNKLTGFASNGIRLQGVATGNNDTIQLNKSEGNTIDGMRAVGPLSSDTETSSGFLIDKNAMKSNGGHDCDDGSSMPPANTWTNDKGDTQNQPGLCKHAETTP